MKTEVSRPICDDEKANLFCNSGVMTGIAAVKKAPINRRNMNESANRSALRRSLAGLDPLVGAACSTIPLFVTNKKPPTPA